MPSQRNGKYLLIVHFPLRPQQANELPLLIRTHTYTVLRTSELNPRPNTGTHEGRPTSGADVNRPA